MKFIPKLPFKEDLKIEGFESIDLQEFCSRDWSKYEPKSPYFPHKLEFYVLLIITKGSVRHKVDLKEYLVNENECLIISPNQIHALNSESEYHGHFFLFTKEYLLNYFTPSTFFHISQLFNYHMFHPVYQLDECMMDYAGRVASEYIYSPYILKNQIISSLFSIILYKLNNRNLLIQSNQNLKQGFDLFEKFKNLIEEEYNKSRNVNDYADQMNISYKHLNEISKRFTNRTAKEFLDDYIILEIKRKLSSTSLSVKEICFETGFDEPTNFVKYFKKATGITPLEFRAAIK
ncbi:AraC family transcriptional regulator [Aquirufa rosea]|uniref:Helix-turn-helix domain-containing protein n=1 Tax=Aquirufa rosea TaxID=2509241 RepID=A0A4Q1BXY3_9BACT|nr:helix-turn-helix domain-containing protein [Aquirufa rosea]RXK47537.1 helix-turn-helix domain-containing protein [Aquirufa rosea]